VHLLRRYLAAFGPATLADVAAWSGLPAKTLRTAVEAVRLRRLRDEHGRELLDVPDAPLPPADAAAPPRLLPPFDNLLLSHADRTRIVTDERRREIIRSGMVDAVFLVDGFVAGRWRPERGRVALEPFEPLSRASLAALRKEADALASWLAGSA
jgi:hypothetical protein